MNLKLLRAFATLAELGSYHEAAEALCMTQPALTKQIQSLENLTGMTLFNRGRHGTKLTLCGAMLYSKSQELLKHYDVFTEYTRRIQRGAVGELTLGFGISSFQIAPRWVNLFREQYPDVEISLNDIPSNVQCHRLLEGTLSAGFTRLPCTDQLKFQAIMEETLVLALPQGVHADPANIQPILNKYPLLQITPQRGRGLAEQVEQFLKENALTGKPASAADDIHTLLALVAEGNGIALLPAGVSHFLPTGVSLIKPMGKNIMWNIGIAWNPHIQDILRDNFLKMVISKKS
ncbi:LysR family transcriptional regulator [Lonsdalea britannica]|uniref:LysR family transcriptional regulator n=1 Tax=Lonsdalea britannica TaxID=1082704 RepID=A0AAD0WL59_9GAMM|nr:LysR family transcriptional regulator [Lonsdalea britannica]AXW87517.1 LysR family transcriptional regulator [Lonsdalea britannica]OSM94468.1 LysR family transcriptional regulator [Lonsdalea britannica]OSN05380.1 LysR family transcriptional regulator [Lonsdalea britannica]